MSEKFDGPVVSELMPIHLAYSNGAIRNAAGKMVAFYDYEEKLLYINGIVEIFRVADMEMAMEIVGEKAER